MNILQLIIAWLFIMAGYNLWNKFKADRETGKSFFDFGDFNFLVASLTLMLVLWGMFSLIAPEPKFISADEQIEYGNNTHQPHLVCDALWKKIHDEPLNADLHFKMLQAHFEWQDEKMSREEMKVFDADGVRIFNYYSDLAESAGDVERQDLGNIFLAMWYILRPGHDAENAAFYLRQVKNKTQKYYNYLIGETNFYSTGPEVAEADFKSEINLNGYLEGSYSELAWIYNITGNKDALAELAYDPVKKNWVDNELRYKVYFLHGDLGSFYLLRFYSIFHTLPFWGILSALLVLFTWLFFLRKLSFLSKIKWMHFFLAVGIGAVLAMLSLLLYAFYHYVLHYRESGALGHDFLYCFAGIGFIEELVKLIPFLIILHFTNIIKRPIDYILIASAAGLGFAFFENLIYISQYGLDVIHARALTACVSHMVSSAIIAYGFILAKFRYPGKLWIIPLFFLAAVFAHGFYDFWLLNEQVRSFSLITLFFYFSEILVYASFINNALNHSVPQVYHASMITLNTQRLASFIAGSLILVFALEYVGNCFVYGTSSGNTSLLSSFLSGGYLLFFLSVRLSNIDIRPNEWGRIEFFAGLFPSQLMRSRKQGGNHSTVGTKFILRRDISSGPFAAHLPLTGTITRKLTIQQDSGWFEFRPDEILSVGMMKHEFIYLRARMQDDQIVAGSTVVAGIYLRMQDPANPEKSKLVFADWVVT
ncbi:MAG: PrsW family intramembrane metalloprotease [Bacteroidetes bacterium]|nr:PrsW family intramembrane metalloprotease [Bacteroidota bacterium]